MSVNTAVKEDSSGEQAYTPKRMASAPAYMWQMRIWLKLTPSVEHSMQLSSALLEKRYHIVLTSAGMAVVAQSE